jgi:hypothetical protein
MAREAAIREAARLGNPATTPLAHLGAVEEGVRGISGLQPLQQEELRALAASAAGCGQPGGGVSAAYVSKIVQDLQDQGLAGGNVALCGWGWPCVIVHAYIHTCTTTITHAHTHPYIHAYQHTL